MKEVSDMNIIKKINEVGEKVVNGVKKVVKFIKDHIVIIKD